MDEMQTGWYYLQGEQQHGPMELEGLRKLVRGGTLGAGALVWHASFGDQWRAVSAVPALQAGGAARPVAPAPATGSGVRAGLALSGGAARPTAAVTVTGQTAAQIAEKEAAYARAREQMHEQAEQDMARHEARQRILKIVAAVVLLAVGAAGTVVYMNHRRIYKDPILLAYGEFANLCFMRKYDEAVKHCVPDSTVVGWVSEEKRRWNNPAEKMRRKLSGGVSTRILFSGYKLLEKTMGADGTGATLKLEQKIRTFRGDTPAQQVLVSEHTVTLQKDGDAWKVKTVTIEDQGAFDPMSGNEITPYK